MQNIAAALAEAGAEMGDVVRVRYILPDRRDFEKTWYVYLGDAHFRGATGRQDTD
jgi:enamine deaminase RidA (YjgF/YER057c/UK114 family)